jgi:molecular chaperone DnaK (HSP70)
MTLAVMRGAQSLSLKAREQLSTAASTKIVIPTAGEQPNIDVTISRNTLDKLSVELLRKMRMPMEQVRSCCCLNRCILSNPPHHRLLFTRGTAQRLP